MKNFLFLPVFLFILLFQSYSQQTASMSHDDGTTHSMINKDEIKWMDGPAGLPAGAKVFVLQGDPSKDGPFTLRAMMPANYKIPAHWHPTMENVSVLEGTMYMGSGEKLDESNAKALKPGGFSSIPAKSPHFVFTKEPCVIQVHAMGPFEITYINEADDPRKMK